MRKPEPCTKQPEVPPRGAERRAWVRFTRRLDLLWDLFGKGNKDMRPARLRDVSAAGVGLVLDCDFPPSTLLTVRLHTGGANWRSWVVRVKNSRRDDGGAFRIGCAFVRPLAEDELFSLLA